MTKNRFKLGNGYTQQDWDEVDSPELTDEELAQMRPFAEVFPELAESLRTKGLQKFVRIQVSLPVIEAYQAKGPDWEARIDADLRKLNNIT